MKTLILIMALAATPSPPPDATTTVRGLVNTRDQAFSGLKTFDGGIWTGTINGFAPSLTTAGPLTLFVDPDAGSDANACTDAGVLACRTVTGAWARVPSTIAHLVTVNLAAGRHVEAFTLEGRDFASGGGVLFEGAPLALAPLDGGFATGTLTLVTQSTSTSPAVLTDSAQTWVPGALRGYYLQIDDAGVAANSAHLISANTATSVTLASGVFPVPVAGNGYSLRTQATEFDMDAGVLIRGLEARQGPSVALGNTIGGFGFRTVSLRRPQAAATVTVSGATVTFTNSRFTSATGTNVSAAPGSVTLNQSLLDCNTAVGGCIAAGGGFASGVGVSMLTLSSLVVRNSGTGSAVRTLAGFISMPSTTGTYEAVATDGSSGVLSITSVTPGHQGPGTYLRCVTAGSGTGVRVGVRSNTQAPTAASLTFNGNFHVQNCGTGVAVAGPANYLTISLPQFTSTTTAVSVSFGGVVDFAGFAPTFTSVTNELQIDGVNSTYANLTAATPQVLFSNFGSRIIR